MNNKNYRLEFTQKAAKKYKKLTVNNKVLQGKLQEALISLIANPFETKLGTHKVQITDYGQVYSSRITGDIRIIWEFSDNKITILVLDVGGHSGARGIYK